jgi:transposase
MVGGMKDYELYQRILGLCEPWRVTDFRLDLANKQVVIVVGHKIGIPLLCPICNKDCGVHDHRDRRWRHLDTCQLQTIIEGSVPRIKCPEHGVHLVKVPWAEPGSRFTALFESMVIDWLLQANIKAVAGLVGLSWDEVDGIQQRAVDRGLALRKPSSAKHIGIDETSFQKHHEYVTVITDREHGLILEVIDDRKKSSVVDWLKALNEKQRHSIVTVSMDMWDGYIGAFLECLPEAEKKICFDRFHIAKYFGDAVSKVRNMENQKLKEETGESVLGGTKFQWLANSENTDNRTRRWFMALTRSTMETAKAWTIKEMAANLWHFNTRTWAEKGWKNLLEQIDRCELPPVKKVGEMVKTHLWGIINAVVHDVTNAAAESFNARIQKIKSMACGFRNRERFRRTILFHLGGLALYPATATPLTHTKS